MKVRITCFDIGVDISRQRLDWLGRNKNLFRCVFHWTLELCFLDQ